MEITSTQKYVKGTPRKLRLVADMVRSMSPMRSLTVLGFADQRAADPLAKAIKVALANAKQQGFNPEMFIFKSLEINEGVKAKRVRPAARGRRRPFDKQSSHIRIVLTDDIKVKSQKSKIKSTIKKLKVEEKGVQVVSSR